MAVATSIHNWPGATGTLFHQAFTTNLGDPLVINPLQQINSRHIHVPNKYESKYKRDNNYRPSIRRSKNYFTKAPDVKSRELFLWNSKSNPHDSRAYSGNDDGVVLLVGLFNLLAVVVYAGQQILSGSSDYMDSRAIFWQVQKALDELVLRVHSSDTAANLISRALKGSVVTETGRKITENKLPNNFVNILISENVTETKTTLNKILDKLKEEISSAPPILQGPKIDSRIYLPIKQLYSKFNKGNDFSSLLLRRTNLLIQTLKKMNVPQIQNVLKTVIRVGQSQSQHNILEALKNLNKNIATKNHSEKNSTQVKSRQKRTRRSPTVISDGRYRNFNPRYSKAAMRYKARKVKELYKKNKSTSNGKPLRNNSLRDETQITKKKGLWDYNETGNKIPTIGRADGWFTLLTEASPIALDHLTLYSRAKANPVCLRALLCKSNGYWKRKGPFQASLSPFLSVITSWGMENVSPHSLGDSIIAIRAGWMGKYCEDLYPECILHGEIHPLTEQTLTYFSEAKEDDREKYSESGESKFHSESGGSQFHSESGESQFHSESGESQFHSESGESQFHSESGESQFHSESGESQYHSESVVSQLHSESGESQLHSESGESQFHSKTGRINIDSEAQESEQLISEVTAPKTTTITSSTEESTTLPSTFSTTIPSTASSFTTTKTTTTTTMITTTEMSTDAMPNEQQSTPKIIVPHIKPQDATEDDIPHPYDRYDSPYYIPPNNEALLYGSVTGMALQDSPLKLMQAEESSILTNTLQNQQQHQQQQNPYEQPEKKQDQQYDHSNHHQLQNHYDQQEKKQDHQHDQIHHQQQYHRLPHHLNHRRRYQQQQQQQQQQQPYRYLNHRQQQQQYNHHYHHRPYQQIQHQHHQQPRPLQQFQQQQQEQQQQKQQQQQPEQEHKLPPILHLKQPNSHKREKYHEVPPQNAPLTFHPDPKKNHLRNPSPGDPLSKRISTNREPSMISGPSFLAEKNYSSYMALQNPAFTKQGHRSIPYALSSSQETIKSPYVKPNLSKRIKYKYGLRRGLPARNVDGHGPLIETESIENPKYQNYYDSYETKTHVPGDSTKIHLQDHHQFQSTTEVPNFSTYLFLPTEKEGEEKFDKFGLNDAITDPLKNEFLFQYVRDRTLNK